MQRNAAPRQWVGGGRTAAARYLNTEAALSFGTGRTGLSISATARRSQPRARLQSRRSHRVCRVSLIDLLLIVVTQLRTNVTNIVILLKYGTDPKPRSVAHQDQSTSVTQPINYFWYPVVFSPYVYMYLSYVRGLVKALGAGFALAVSRTTFLSAARTDRLRSFPR